MDTNLLVNCFKLSPGQVQIVVMINAELEGADALFIPDLEKKCLASRFQVHSAATSALVHDMVIILECRGATITIFSISAYCRYDSHDSSSCRSYASSCLSVSSRCCDRCLTRLFATYEPILMWCMFRGSLWSLHLQAACPSQH
jgi:hypothetical protein